VPERGLRRRRSGYSPAMGFGSFLKRHTLIAGLFAVV
jgi:hypothetical protein